jgi:hypothetical protein
MNPSTLCFICLDWLATGVDLCYQELFFSRDGPGELKGEGLSDCMIFHGKTAARRRKRGELELFYFWNTPGVSSIFGWGTP